MFLMRNDENYPSIIFKYPPYLAFCGTQQNLQNDVYSAKTQISLCIPVVCLLEEAFSSGLPIGCSNQTLTILNTLTIQITVRIIDCRLQMLFYRLCFASTKILLVLTVRRRVLMTSMRTLV